MINLGSMRQTIQVAIFSSLFSITGAAQTLAKDAAPSSSSGGGGGGAWVWAYMIVLLFVALGLIVVCKSSGRRERAKPEVYTEAKAIPKE
jgi:SNF family Na+-dependent transporter